MVFMFVYVIIVRLFTVGPKKIFEGVKETLPLFLTVSIVAGIVFAILFADLAYTTPASRAANLVGFQSNSSSYYLEQDGKTIYYHTLEETGLHSRRVMGSWVIVPTTGTPEVVKHYLVAQNPSAKWWFLYISNHEWYEFRITDTKHIFQIPST
ncbi:MAG: hypothetical protein NTX26_01625 [Candidatus Parcubacteria bacterium]|nr:hypothetical protein [Candidatus Parcubacteria bacterium]